MVFKARVRQMCKEMDRKKDERQLKNKSRFFFKIKKIYFERKRERKKGSEKKKREKQRKKK